MKFIYNYNKLSDCKSIADYAAKVLDDLTNRTKKPESFIFIYDIDKPQDIEICDEYLMDRYADKFEEIFDYDDVVDTMRRAASGISDKATEYNVFPDHIKNYEEFKYFAENVQLAFENQLPFVQRKCKVCGEPFYLFKSEVEFFNNQNFPLPKRCKSCRIKAKNLQLEQAV